MQVSQTTCYWLMLLVTLYSIADAQVCFRKFSVERKACKGRIKSARPLSNDISSCCSTRSQGYAEQLVKIAGSKNWYICTACTKYGSPAATDVHNKHSTSINATDVWSAWSDWTSCSQSCGEGYEQRTRFCLTTVTCQGDDYEQRPCPNLSPCPVDGVWSSWTHWHECTASCGVGSQTRTRTCSNPAPQFGGADCHGFDTEYKNCSANVTCQVDGGWSDWSEWSRCNATCGPAEQQRRRYCDNPPPRNGGESCEGALVEYQPCHQQPCPVDGGWSEWGAWTVCSAVCGEGFQTRSRNCDSPHPQHGGHPCEGLELESMPCVTRTDCPVDGGWTEWSRVDVCSAAPCSGLKGHKTRLRSCTNPRPMFGGVPCRGRTWKIEPCYNNDFCTQLVDGGWCMWSEWSKCDGNDVRKRIRNCQCPPPVNGGRNCDGQEVEEKSCQKVRIANATTTSRGGETGCHVTEGSGDGSDIECDQESEALTTSVTDSDLDEGSGSKEV